MNVSMESLTIKSDGIELIEKGFNLERLLRITAYVLRFVKHTREPGQRRVGWQIQEDEMAQARVLWQRNMQMKQLRWYRIMLSFEPEGSKIIGHLRQYRISLNADQLVVVELTNTPPNQQSLRRIMIHENSTLFRLEATNIHVKALHCSAGKTMKQFRKTYWTWRPSRMIANAIRACDSCPTKARVAQ